VLFVLLYVWCGAACEPCRFRRRSHLLHALYLLGWTDVRLVVHGSIPGRARGRFLPPLCLLFSPQSLVLILRCAL
jgi:hypothetical protein